MPKSRLIIEWVLIAALALLAVIGTVRGGLASRIDVLLLDQLNGLSVSEANQDIVLIEIDDRSLAKIGAWPWPRTVHAQLIDQLAKADAKAIAYDVLFTEPTTLFDDDALATALKNGNRVFLPSYVRTPGSDGREADLVSPLPNLLQSAAGTGHVHIVFDDDGVVRRMQPSFSINGQALPHFIRAVAAAPINSFVSDELLPFRPVGSYPRVPFSAVAAGEVPDGFFKGKTVLVGATAVGMRDSYPVPGPAGGTMSGIEIQANYLDAIESGGLIKIIDEGRLLALSIMPVCLLLLFFWIVRPTLSILLSVTMVVVILGFSLGALFSFSLWIPPSAALIGVLLAYPLWSWRRLAALNSFVEAETASVSRRSMVSGDGPQKGLGFDSVAKSASRLKSVIGAIEDAKDYMGSVISNAPDALCVVDAKDVIVLTNDAARALFGSDMSGQTVAAVLASLGGSASEEGDELALPDGRLLLLNRAPFTQGADQATGSILRLADITILQEAAREREQMLEFLSHDMRSPQAAIITLLSRIKGEEVSLENLHSIQGHAKHTLKLADDFVQLARLSAADFVLEECDVVGLTNEAIDRCYSDAQEKKIILVRPDEESELLIMADPWPLLRALTNLIDNAIKYSLPLSQVKCRVLRLPSGEVSISIADQGEGVPEDRQANLFKPYGPASATKGLSAGLGLSYVKKTVDRLGGEIRYQAGNPGSVFVLTFPGA